jgi:hypothetical protein
VIKELLVNNLYRKIEKAEFHSQEIVFLGYIVGGAGV